MRNRLEHLQSPSAPTQPTYTHLSHTALCTNSDCTCITHRKNTARTSACRSHSSHSLSHAQTHKHTHAHTCARFAGGVTSCRDRTTNTSLSLCGFAEPECTALPSQADVPPPPRSHKYPPWVLYGPILFSPTQSQRCHGHVLLSL